MTRYKYDFRRVYREILQEEAGAAPAGAMSASGSASVTGNSGDGTSSNQGSYGPDDARVFNGFTFSVDKRKFQEMLNGSGCKKESVKEACENCNCEKCSSEKGTALNEACMKHLKEFFGESFVIEEYIDEGADKNKLSETILVSIKKAGDDQGQQQGQQQPPSGQAHATNICQKCNTEPCKCQPVQGQGDPNLNGQIVVQPQ